MLDTSSSLAESQLKICLVGSLKRQSKLIPARIIESQVGAVS